MNDILPILQDGVGLVLPPFIDYINQHIENTTIRFIVSLVFCAVVAVVLNLDKVFTGDWTNLLGRVGLVFTEAQVIYKTYWAKSSARAKIYGRAILS